MENKSLIKIISESASIEQALIESGGEITQDIEKLLEVNAQELTQKVDGYFEVINRFDALEAHYKAKAQFFSDISKQCAGVVDRLKNNIKYAMNELQTNEIKGHDVRFKMSETSGSLVIEDEELIPLDFKKEIVTTSIDKVSLKKALASEKIAGARLEKGQSLRMYANLPDKKTNKIEVKDE